VSASRLVIFGAAGDLTGRYLLRALAELDAARQLPAQLAIVGVDRENWDDDAFRAHAAARLARHAPDIAASTREALAHRLRYCSGDVTDPAAARSALAGGSGPVVAYLALPPTIFEPTITALAEAALPPGSRVVVEKPFGTDLDSARALNELLHRHFPESSVFRMDHFLGMQTVLNVLGLRFANRLFEPLWCAEHIERVDIVWDETVALEGRAGYYDHTGALLDMIQNHLLQLVALIAMERPAGLGEQPLRDAKVDVLRAIPNLSRAAVAEHTVRARYTAGRRGDDELPDYTAEDGVDPARGTETFVDVTLSVDNPRWHGVPFRLRSGKALGADRRAVTIRLRPTERLPFGQAHEPPNVITLAMDPDRLAADIALNGTGDPFDLEPAHWELELAPQRLSAYARLMLDALDGDPSFSIRGDEAEESWRIVEPIIDAWNHGASPLREYPAGSDGPTP
jgi:glucose-6-phosphate 1-dehydrogenase